MSNQLHLDSTAPAVEPGTALATMARAQIFPPATIPPDKRKFPLEAVYSFAALRGKFNEGQVFAFTSAHRGEGVSHVVGSLGRHLASYCGADVLIISPPHLRRLRALDVEQIEAVGRETDPRLWTLPPELPNPAGRDAPVEEDLWKVLRTRFRYVLLDCSALDTSGDVLSLAPRVDGIALVVQAGRTLKPDIQKAVRLLSLATASPFIGCILNQRTYPVPGFLYRTL